MIKSFAAFILLAFALGVNGCAVFNHRSSVQAAEEYSDLQEELLEEMLISEALYTLAGGLKPVSSSFWRATIAIEKPSLTEVSEARIALKSFEDRYPDFDTGVMAFANTYEGERYLDAFVAHRSSVSRMIDTYSEFWAPYGVTQEMAPAEVILTVEHMPKLDRFRGYGYLFGYPDYAVDFFVEAAAHEDGTDDFVERDFRQIPTIASETGRFTYAVPKGYPVQPVDRELLENSLTILSMLRKYRNNNPFASPSDQLDRVLDLCDNQFRGSAGAEEAVMVTGSGSGSQ